MKWTSKTAVLLLTVMLAVMTVGCNAVPSTATQRDAELVAAKLNDMKARLVANNDAVDRALDAMGSLSARSLEAQHGLQLNIAKAKLLESMKSPWIAQPTGVMQRTQQAVALYHLYSLAEAQREVLDAQIQKRRAALNLVRQDMVQLIQLTGQAIDHEKLVLAYFERPMSVQIAASVQVIMEEVRAFHGQLAKSEHPELVELSAKIAKSEQRASKIVDAIEKALDEVKQ